MHKRKSIIIHDFFLYRGGAERFDIMAANAMDSDMAAAYFDEGSFDLSAMGFVGQKRMYGAKKFHGGLRYLYYKICLLFKTGFLKEYDTVVFSGDTLSAVRHVRGDAAKVCYFHSIPRYLFDQKELYYSKVPLWARPAYLILRWVFLRMFLSDLSKMDRIYVNSKNLQKYLKQYIGYDAEIIYPPVDTKVFSPVNTKVRFYLPQSLDGAWGLHTGDSVEYYVSYSKVATLKRVIEAVKAFREMPEKKLLVIYGANDPQKDEMLSLASLMSNIECRILSDNGDLPEIVARAIATIFIPKNEDFGMVATESMSCGVPVIGVAEGGLLETVIDGENGILISGELTVEKLKIAVGKMTREYSQKMGEACKNRALLFSKEQFEENIQKEFR